MEIVMEIKDRVQIFIITYNRYTNLEKTLKSILQQDSPVRGYNITILDNASTDGSSELIDDYCRRFSNLNHVRHKRNIGGNANICRAFELASYPYVWVLCDDDEYDWSHWNEVERAVNEEKDLIVVSNYIHPESSVVNLFEYSSILTIFKQSRALFLINSFFIKYIYL